MNTAYAFAFGMSAYLYLFLTSSSASPSSFTLLPVPDRAKQLFLIMDMMFARPPSNWATHRQRIKTLFSLPYYKVHVF